MSLSQRIYCSSSASVTLLQATVTHRGGTRGSAQMEPYDGSAIPRGRIHRLEPGQDPDVAASPASAADGLLEGLAEGLRRPIVDDGVDAGVEVGETAREDAVRAEEVAVRRGPEVPYEQHGVDGEPEDGEEQYDKYEESARLLLLAEGLGVRVTTDHTVLPMAGDVRKDAQIEETDDHQWNDVGEREERREYSATEFRVVEVTARLCDAVAQQDGNVQRQHQDPDCDDYDDDVALRSQVNCSGAVHDRHIAHDRDYHQCVHGNVGCYVYEVM